MSALRGHRGAKGRLVAVAAALCLLVAVVYLHGAKVQHQDDLRKCETDHRAVHAQLKGKQSKSTARRAVSGSVVGRRKVQNRPANFLDVFDQMFN